MVNGWPEIVQAVLPPVCVLCGDTGQLPDTDLCAACEADLPVNEPACRTCARPLAGDIGGALMCGACLGKAPRYQSAWCAFRYAYPVDHMVRALKYHGAIVQGRVFGGLLARILARRHAERWPDCIVPVPLAQDRFRERGYNQAIEIARPLGRRLGLPLCTDLAVRHRPTREQAALSGKERRRNVRGAFSVTRRLNGESVAILDDVVTTGSTVGELARVLRRAGAGRIEVWAVAHSAS